MKNFRKPRTRSNDNSSTSNIYPTYPSPMYKYTIANVNLRETKSTSANILAVIPSGTKVQVLDGEEDWYLVSYNTLQGYIYMPLLSTTKYTYRDSLLRSYPTAESNPLAIVPKGSEVQVLSTNGNWSSVIFNNRAGYIFSPLLTDDGAPPDAYDFTYFTTDMTRFVNENNIKSPTPNLITTDLENKLTYVFSKGTNDLWNQLYKWECTVGAPETPTIKGTFYVTGRKPYFGSDTYRVKYATRIQGSYYYHSILFNPEGTEIINASLGLAISHGCIRLAVENAQWIYNNILDATAIIIN